MCQTLRLALLFFSLFKLPWEVGDFLIPVLQLKEWRYSKVRSSYPVTQMFCDEGKIQLQIDLTFQNKQINPIFIQGRFS